MGRSKPLPKRRRIDEEEAERAAIQALLDAPSEQVEAAAAEATRKSCEAWPSLSLESTAEKVPDWLKGLGKTKLIPPPHFEALRSLHELIKEQATTWTSWSGSREDPRKRAFGFVPDTLGYEEKTRASLDISTPWKDDDDGKEKQRNNRAMVVLEKPPVGVLDAIEYLCQEFSTDLDDDAPLKKYLKYSNLIAAQPNLHCGRKLLPTHVDHPLKDGFGIIIITIAIKGSGTLLLRDSAAKNGTTMEVAQGHAYMLADKARDACAHGVLATGGERESLNLRFGLHDYSYLHLNLPLVPAHQVLQYWEDDTNAADGKQTST